MTLGNSLDVPIIAMPDSIYFLPHHQKERFGSDVLALKQTLTNGVYPGTDGTWSEQRYEDLSVPLLSNPGVASGE